MISAVGPQQSILDKKSGFYMTPEMEKEFLDSHAHIVAGDVISKARYNVDKFQNAVSLYPLKGMKGSVNSNFYEFLTMGIVPYLIGSGMLIALFNAATKYFEPSQARFAAKTGRGMAMGVIFYGIIKNISKKFIEIPVYLKNGVDINMPYKDMKAQLPENPNMEKNKTKLNEHHKVFESVDFPRWDLLYDMKEDRPRNYYYDKVAKRMGLGKDLVDSDQEVKPMIREMIIKTRTWSTISSYFWAALGVALAVQDGWDEVLPVDKSRANIFTEEFADNLKKAIKRSCKELWEGGVNKDATKAVAGKTLVGLAAVSTLWGASNALFNFFGKHSDLIDGRIDFEKDYTVG